MYHVKASQALRRSVSVQPQLQWQDFDLLAALLILNQWFTKSPRADRGLARCICIHGLCLAGLSPSPCLWVEHAAIGLRLHDHIRGHNIQVGSVVTICA